MTQGVVSGFQAQPEVSARAWIITDATMSGGSSGGTAINRRGELIGVPTWGTELDCRPGDVNHDGRLDALDVGCVPVGGSLGNLRPSNFARELLARTGLASPSHATGSVPAPAVMDLLPAALPLEHAGCFRVEDDGVLTFDELTARLGGGADAAARLQDWGWQASAFRTFACDTPPDGEAGWMDVSVHRFADAAAAQEALDYFSASRAAGTRLLAGAPPALGDRAAVLTGPTTNGKEFTLYVSRGPLLLRVTGVSRTGIPFIDVLAVARTILQTPLPEVSTVHAQSTASPAEPVAVYLPASLPLAEASCFRADDMVTLDFPALVDRFPGVPEAATRLQQFGWQAGASRQFSCDGPPAGHVGWIDLSVHQFRDAASAAAAVPFFASSRALGTSLKPAAAPSMGDTVAALAGPATNGTEYTLYLSTGPLMFRVTGVAPDGDPASDVQRVMLGLLAGSLIVDQRASPPVVAPTPPPPTVIPTPMVSPTAVTIPTAAPVPTATPTPSPTPLPQPTATSTPTPIPSPTATATPFPTSLPTSTAVPTSTPRAIAVPTVTPDSAAGPTAEAEHLVDRLLSAEFPDTLLAYGSAREPTLDAESAPEEGFFGTVDIYTGGAMDGGISSIRYAVFAGAEEAEREYGRWRRDHGSFADEELDVSGPALGPNAVVLLFLADSPFGGCGAQVGNVLVTVSVVEGPETNHLYLYERVLGNCEGAVAHLRSVMAQTP